MYCQTNTFDCAADCFNLTRLVLRMQYGHTFIKSELRKTDLAIFSFLSDTHLIDCSEIKETLLLAHRKQHGKVK